MNKLAKLALATFVIGSMSAAHLEAKTPGAGFSSTFKPHVIWTKAHFVEIEYKYRTKIKFCNRITEVVSDAKDGLDEVLDTLFKALPDGSERECRKELSKKIANSLINIKAVNEEEVRKSIEDAFSSVQSDDSESTQKLVKYAYEASCGIIVSAKEKIKTLI